MDNLEQALVETQRYARPQAIKVLRKYPDDVDDAMQNAAIKALRYVHDFRGTAQFRVWFTRVVINEALMHLRKKKGEGRLVDLDEEISGELVFELPSPEPSPEMLAVSEEVCAVVRNEVAKMTPPKRSEFGFALLGIGVGNNGTRKARRFHVRRILRGALSERGMMRT